MEQPNPNAAEPHNRTLQANAGEAFRAQQLFRSSGIGEKMMLVHENTANEGLHGWFDPAASQSFALVPHSHKVRGFDMARASFVIASVMRLTPNHYSALRNHA